MGEAYLLYQNNGTIGQNIIYDDENRKPGHYLVRFYDYDGTILKEEWVKPGEGVSPPVAPAHNNLVFQGWTHDENALAEILHDLDVGAIYCTSSGRTHIHIFLDEATGLEMTLVFTKADDSILYVEWGDNNTNSSSDVGFVRFTHTYSDYGNYIIDVHIGEGNGLYTFGGYDGDFWYSINNQITYNYFYNRKYYAIQKVNIGGNIISIGQHAFVGCLGLKELTIPDQIRDIQHLAFMDCCLKHINVPYHVETFGGATFSNCGIQSIVIPPGITEIPENCFAYNNNLKKVILPDTVTRIGNAAFCYCNLLKTVYIPAGVTDLGQDLFIHDYNLSQINMPASLTNWGAWIFYNCSNLININIPENITYICENAFGNCSALETVEMPIVSEITEIRTSAFENCSNLKEINLPDSLITLGNEVFRGCYKLKSIEIPVGILNMGINLFVDCNALENIICRPTIPPILSGDLFGPVLVPNSYFKIYVPANSVDLYKADENWGKYADYIYPIT